MDADTLRAAFALGCAAAAVYVLAVVAARSATWMTAAVAATAGTVWALLVDQPAVAVAGGLLIVACVRVEALDERAEIEAMQS